MVNPKLSEAIQRMNGKKTEPVKPVEMPEPIKEEVKETAKVEAYNPDIVDDVTPKQEEKATEKPSNEVTEQQKEQILMEIEMLQNNGRFRAELLHQLMQINVSLTKITEAIS